MRLVIQNSMNLHLLKRTWQVFKTRVSETLYISPLKGLTNVPCH